jgi:hypothetical protein
MFIQNIREIPEENREAPCVKFAGVAFWAEWRRLERPALFQWLLLKARPIRALNARQ